MIAAIFFGLFAGITIFSAIAISLEREIINSAFYLLLVLLGLACLYILLEADFLAVTQILIYVGGILILFLFGLLVTKNRISGKLKTGSHNKIRSAILVISLGIMLLTALFKEKNLLNNANFLQSSSHTIGFGLLGDYLLPFEIAGVILLGVLIGVLVLSSSIKSR